MGDKPQKIGDKKSVDDRKKDLENKKTSLDLALRDVMSAAPGRSLIWWVLEQAHTFAQPADFSEGELGRRMTDFKCGEQNVGKRLMTRILRVCPEQYIQASREAIK